MQERHAEEAQGGAGGPASLTKETILGRIAAYEIAFGIRPNGRSMPNFSGYFSGRMGVAELHEFEQGDGPGQTGGVPQVRPAAYHKMDANRREWSGDDVTRCAALDETLKLSGYMVDKTEKKLPVCSVDIWAEMLMKKVSEAAAVGDVFSAQAVRTAQAENQRLRQQLSQMEARMTAQQVPATPRFHGVCDNCKVYGHQARECTATRRPEGSSKGSANGGGRGGQQGVQPGGKGGKGDAGGRGRGRAVAAVNQAAPGSQPFVMTDAQFNRWMTAQGK
jgi:hypothetical protein